eukprot:14807629-Alexandrium_andersonii.AAC.1
MSASLVGSEMCIRDRLGASNFCRFGALERTVRALGEAQPAAFSSLALAACLLYTSDAADDM